VKVITEDSASAQVAPGAAARFYRPELDALRCFAAFGVFVFHSFPKQAPFWIAHGVPSQLASGLVSILGSGGYGVDLFFALSSFLITELLLREREQRGYLDVWAFYVRRVLRIWPLYFFFIFLSFALTFVDRSQHLDAKYIAGYLLLAGNWMVVIRGMPESIAIPLWSVSIEEQFYISWPQVVKASSQRIIAYVAGGLVALSFLSRVLLASQGIGQDAVWCNTLTRLDPIAMGILFAIYVRRRTLQIGKLARPALAGLGLGCWILVTTYGGLHETPARFWGIVLGYPAVSVGSIAFLASAYRAPEAGYRFLKNGLLLYLGKISYGIYVYHILGLLI